MFSAPGPLELVVILVIALIFLGPNRLPDAARSVGKGMREFRESLSGFDGDGDESPYDANELESDDPDDEDPPRAEALAQDAAPVSDAVAEPAPERDS